MSEDTTQGGTPVPPKLSLKKENQPATIINLAGKDRATKKQTARIEFPEPPAEPVATLKKKTSRIPLDQLSAESGAAQGSPVAGVGASKTIRLTSPSAIPTITIAPSAKSLSAALNMDEAKRQTSRIPLESAITEADTATTSQQSDAPKTIRIKRPTVTQSITPAAERPLAPPPPPAAQEQPPAGKGVTSRIELPPEPEATEESQLTQRKTIKIRRAEGGATIRAAPRSPVVARMELAAAEHAAEEVAGQISAPHGAFPALAAVAVILLCVLVYVLFTQAFPNLGWSFPGKVTL